MGPRAARDILAVIPLDSDPREPNAHEAFGSNSAAGPPAAVDVLPDERHAIVVEAWNERPGNDDPHVFGDSRLATLSPW